jgi:hypothetical protein|tara:strand:- start:741 stop:1031 length:291 start_codon:yes stop_codon:yes gene_type:complete
MRWLALALLSTAMLVAAQQKQCIVSDFYAVSWIGEPTMRHMQLSMWLTTNGGNCTAEQLLVIWNNLAMWAGVADSAELRGKLLYFFARAREREEKK